MVVCKAGGPVSGKAVAVTGGAQGIGREIARLLVESGAWVVIGDRDVDAARSTAAELGPRAVALALDVTSTESFLGFLTGAEDAVGPLDVLVNNAGVMWVGPFDAEPDSATDAMLAVNLRGVIRGVRLAAPAMRERGAGHIVTVASAAARLAPPGEATYAATKHGVLGYLTAVREELRGSGVAITAVMPVVVDTKLAEGTDAGGAALLQPEDVAQAVASAIRRPRFEVTVPGYVGPLARAVALLPQRVRDAVHRRLVPDQVEAVRGSGARADYESRALGGAAGEERNAH
ncbi:SDR family oxidoreductase [Tomitella gaofuii]|uniref:SDR family oxidoreductase n=1 Tax=Tomitella gaofuii TaxID=2760083 RepID=UPI0015F7A87C|nr:SDR family oxidoreductase [Tomitella gaofuii]